MGSLIGHVIPGMFFIIFGIWWSFITHIRFIHSKKRSPFSKHGVIGYHGSVTMPCICLPCKRLRRAPVESYMKLIFTIIGFLIEFLAGVITHQASAGYWIDAEGSSHNHGSSSSVVNMTMISQHDHNNHEHAHSQHDMSSSLNGHQERIFIKSWFPIEINNAQHMTMYLSFMFGAFIEILAYHRYDLPKMLEHAFGLLGFGVEGFLFAFHLHGRNQIDIHLHTLLVYSIFACFLFTCFEIYNQKQILFAYGRILFTLVQGTWFIQTGMVLYPPTSNPYFNWDPNDHVEIMLITFIYCWHVMFIIALLLVEFAFMKRLYARSHRLAARWDELIAIDEEAKNSEKYTVSTFNSSGINETKFLRLLNEDDDSGDERVEFDSMKLNGTMKTNA